MLSPTTHRSVLLVVNLPNSLGDRELADVEIANPGTPDISMSSESSETLQSTSTNQAPVGTQSN